MNLKGGVSKVNESAGSREDTMLLLFDFHILIYAATFNNNLFYCQPPTHEGVTQIRNSDSLH